MAFPLPRVFLIAFILFLCVPCPFGNARPDDSEPLQDSLMVVAIGDAGETGTVLRGNARYLTDMFTGEHDGGKFDVMVFLGDNFYTTGLNIPADEVDRKVDKILGPYRVPFDGLGRSNVHAIPGNHDYYARNAVEKSLLFGLVTIEEMPFGLTDKGNRREQEILSWTYHHRLPAQVLYPVVPGSADSVQLIFFDTSLPLRTDPATWRPALDSLSRILSASASRREVLWRVFCGHHPFYSVGEHGGYSVWNDEDSTVAYLTNCDKDSNAYGWVRNWLEPQDLCAEKYRRLMDSLKAVFRGSGARIHLALAGHDHSLQLLSYETGDGECDACPKVYVISGAGSDPTRVKLPHPPYEFTASQRDGGNEGVSAPGFVQLRFSKDRIRIVFFNGRNGEPIDMGGGRREFGVDREGRLVN